MELLENRDKLKILETDVKLEFAERLETIKALMPAIAEMKVGDGESVEKVFNSDVFKERQFNRV